MRDKSISLAFRALFTMGAFITATVVFSEGNHKGGHGAHWMSPKDAASRVNPIKSNNDSINRGKEIYINYCSSCHGEKAMGDGPASSSLDPKPTNLKAMSGGHSDGDFAWKIANGRGAMPGWQGVLNENQIWDLVNFIQSLKNESKSPEAKGDADHDHKKHSHKKKHSH